MTEEVAKFVLRIPPKLHKKIRKGAKADALSMNQFIVNGMIDYIDPKKNPLRILTERLEENLLSQEGKRKGKNK